MELGLAHFLTDYGMAPAELGRLAEELGFESLFFPEHTHIPVSRDTPYPGGGELPPEYSHTLDPFVALAVAAAATERLKLGTGVCLVIERDAIVTAKEVATLDQISGGRFLFGVGAGWNREEMENHGTDPGTRFRRMRESVEAMKATSERPVASRSTTTTRRSSAARRRVTKPRAASVPVTSVALALLQPSRRRSVFSSSEPPAVVSTTSTEKPAAVTPSRSSSSARRLRTADSARSSAWRAR